MQIVTMKKKKVLTIRCSDTMLSELHTAIAHFFQWKEKMGVHDISIEDEDCVVRFIVDETEMERVRGEYLVEKRIFEIRSRRRPAPPSGAGKERRD